MLLLSREALRKEPTFFRLGLQARYLVITPRGWPSSASACRHRTCTAHAPHMHVHSSLPAAHPMHVHVHVPRTPCTHHAHAMDIPRPAPHRWQVYALLAELGMHCDVTLAAKQLRCRPVYATPLPKPTSRELRDGTPHNRPRTPD